MECNASIKDPEPSTATWPGNIPIGGRGARLSRQPHTFVPAKRKLDTISRGWVMGPSAAASRNLLFYHCPVMAHT